MVFEEELEKFLLMSPLDFVVILHNIRLIGGVLGRSALSDEREREQENKQGKQQGSSLESPFRHDVESYQAQDAPMHGTEPGRLKVGLRIALRPANPMQE